MPNPESSDKGPCGENGVCLLSNRWGRAGLLLGLGALLALAIYLSRGSGQATPAPAAEGGEWRVGAVALEKDDPSDPSLRLIAVVLGKEGEYEKRLFRDPAVAALLPKFHRIRLDIFRDSSILAPYGVKGAPALLLLTPDHRLVTRRVGIYDPAEVVRTLEGALEFPIAREELLVAVTPPPDRRVRAAEVAIEAGDSAAALALSQAAVEAAGETGLLAVRAGYALAQALGNVGRWEEAAGVAAKVLLAAPEDPLAPAVAWVEVVSLMRSGRPVANEAIEARIEKILEKHPASPYARETILAYALRRLPSQGPAGMAASLQYLRKMASRSAPYAADARFAQAFLLRQEYAMRRNPDALSEAVGIYRELAAGEGRIADESIETLVGLALAPELRGTDLFGTVTIYLRELLDKSSVARRPRIQFLLGNLEWQGGSAALAAKDLEAVTADPEFGPKALLLLGTIRLDGLNDPENAVRAFEEAHRRGLDADEAVVAAYGRARGLFFMKSWDAAERAFAEVLTIPDLPRPMRGEAENYLQRIRSTKETEHRDLARLVDAVLMKARGQKAEALAALDALVAEAPASPVAPAALFEAARIRDSQGDREGSLRALRAIKEHYPGSNEAEIAKRVLGGGGAAASGNGSASWRERRSDE